MRKAHMTPNSIRAGAYFLSNSLHSTNRKYISINPVSMKKTRKFHPLNVINLWLVKENTFWFSTTSAYKCSPKSHTEARCVPWIVVTFMTVKRNGAQKITRLVESWYKHWNCCGWRKGTSWKKKKHDVVQWIEEIKSVALPVVELCLPEGIS